MSLKALAKRLETFEFELGLILDGTLLRFPIEKIDCLDIIEGMTYAMVLTVGKNKVVIGADSMKKLVYDVPYLLTDKMIEGYKICNLDSDNVFYIFREMK